MEPEGSEARRCEIGSFLNPTKILISNVEAWLLESLPQ
jgi:hypothetical protein